MKGVIGKNVLDSKAITYLTDGDGLQFPMVITAFEGEGHEAFDRSGYRGRYVIFTLIEGGIQECVTDPHDMELELANDELKAFMNEVRQGWRTEGHDGINWAELEDAEVYTRDDFSPLH